MAALETPNADIGASAPSFALIGTDGKTYTFADVQGTHGTVILFMCNHCPFVKAVIDRLIDDMRALQAEGIGVAAIMSNDVENYPDDSPERMKEFALQHGMPFVYLYDETQQVARDYGAVCTPDFFGFDRKGKLGYRGRLDEGRLDPPAANATRDLVVAMRALAGGTAVPSPQLPSIGCSIKWK